MDLIEIKQCAICCENIQVGEEATSKSYKTSCSHHFHNKCITPWLLKKSTCPICRNKLVDVDSEDELSDEEEEEPYIIDVNFSEKHWNVVNTELEREAFEVTHELIQTCDEDNMIQHWFKDGNIKHISFKVKKHEENISSIGSDCRCQIEELLIKSGFFTDVCLYYCTDLANNLCLCLLEFNKR